MNMFCHLPFLFCLLSLLLVGMTDGSAQEADASSKTNQSLLYVGTYTGAKSKGIYLYQLDQATGELKSLGLAAETESPSFLALDPSHHFLYAVNEVDNFGGKPQGAISAFSVEPESGKLTFINQQPTGGGGPCHVIVDHTGQCVVVANYGGGSVAAYTVAKDGRLSPPTTFIQHTGGSVNQDRQQGPHAHCVTLDAANRYAFICDLGLDKVLGYRLDPAKGLLNTNEVTAVSLAPGAGPRHLAFHPNGKFGYVIAELDSTITAFTFDAGSGSFKELQTVSTLPPSSTRRNNSTAEIAVHPSGRFLYGSNRGHNSIVVFAIDPATGKLTYIENDSTQGRTPRNFVLDPTGAFLLAANQDTDRIVVFQIDPKNGRLRFTTHYADAPSPVCLTFLAQPRPSPATSATE